MKAYKLTNENGQTKNNTQWGENITHSVASNANGSLCSDGWIHFYTNPLIAILMNPVHANFINPKLWECETNGKELHEAVKSGCKILTTIKEIPIPEISIIQKVAFAILYTKEVYKDSSWNKWADKWLDNIDRTKETAAVARGTIYVSIAAAADAAIYAADAAVAAADAARYAVYAAAAYTAAYSAVYADAAYADAAAAANAANAAAAYADADADADHVIELAEKAMTY